MKKTFISLFLILLIPLTSEAAFRYFPDAGSNTVDFCFADEASCEARVSAIKQAGGKGYKCVEVSSCVDQEMIPQYDPPGSYDIEKKVTNPLQSASLGELLTKLIRALTMVIIPILILVIVYSGFMFVIGSTSEDRLKKAKKNALYATIGIIIILGANILVAIAKSLVAIFSTI